MFDKVVITLGDLVTLMAIGVIAIIIIINVVLSLLGKGGEKLLNKIHKIYGDEDTEGNND